MLFLLLSRVKESSGVFISMDERRLLPKLTELNLVYSCTMLCVDFWGYSGRLSPSPSPPGFPNYYLDYFFLRGGFIIRTEGVMTISGYSSFTIFLVFTGSGCLNLKLVEGLTSIYSRILSSPKWEVEDTFILAGIVVFSF